MSGEDISRSEISMAKRATNVTFVVMAGGRGERLWPLVRQAVPKVCLAPAGTRTLLRMTIDRLRSVWPGAAWLIVTTQEQSEIVRSCLPAGMRQAVLVEPQIKDTAACITLAAIALAMQDPSGVMVVVPADHWIGDLSAYRSAIRAAIGASVAHETIATIGIRPTAPHPGLGYLCAGSFLSGNGVPRIFRLARFVEKPSLAQAERLLARPQTYWNHGAFIGRADTFLECVTEWLPDHTKRLAVLAEDLRDGLARRRAVRRETFARRARAIYRTLQPISFDHGVMSRLQGGVVIEGGFQWTDLGNWDVWTRFGRAATHTLAIKSRNVAVFGQERHLVATIGVRDLLIVHTPSATLVCRADQAQAVRDVVKRLGVEARFAPYR